LHGDGTTGADTTAYTKLWSGYECDITTQSVVYVDAGTDTIPATLTANTVYVLNGGEYITTTVSNMITTNSCNSLIGKEESILRSFNKINNMIYGLNHDNLIFDNLILD